MIETVITIKLKTDQKTFEAPHFQEVLQSIKTGEMRRNFESARKTDKWIVTADCSYWTNYKQKKNEHNMVSNEEKKDIL